MKTMTFSGGIHPEEQKLTADCPIEKIGAGDTVSVLLSQHIGAPAVPCVVVGQHVKKGEKIAEAAEGLSCPVHASVSGTVRAIGPVDTADGTGEAITIENDFREESCPDAKPFETPLAKADVSEMIAFIKEKGIVGMGGATFPTWFKIQSSRGLAEWLVVNCAECEPYLTANHRLLLEYGKELLDGVRILMRVCGVEKAVFAIEDNKLDAARHIQSLLPEGEGISMAVMKTKYPQGDERQLVRALFGREIPKGKLPADAGVVIFNAETCWAVYRAFILGQSVVDRIVTVSGDCVKSPANLLVPIGVSVREVLERCGLFSHRPDKIISGGPMMGKALWSTAIPVSKGVGGILAIQSPAPEHSNCIHCGRCVRHCPMHLMPLELYRSVQQQNWREASDYSLLSCSECGSCTFSCPAKIPILQNIRIGKSVLRGMQKK